VTVAQEQFDLIAHHSSSPAFIHITIKVNPIIRPKPAISTSISYRP